MVLHNARLKAMAVARKFPSALILGADTTVALGDSALNKPADLAESWAMLRRLSGREHTVHTGVCLVCLDRGLQEEADITAWVRFKALSDDDITRYQSLVNTLDKAGAYGIQDWIGQIGVTKIEGSYFNVMGFPMDKIYRTLLTF